MKKITLLLFGFILVNLELKAQEWTRVIETFTEPKSGGTIPGFCSFIDTNDVVTLGGWIQDSVYVFDKTGETVVKKIYNVENMLQCINGVWQKGPHLPLSDFNATLIAHPPPLYGKQYLSMEGDQPVWVLNSLNQFEPLQGIQFTNGYFHYGFKIGNNKILFLSKGEGGSFSAINGDSYRFAVIWNCVTDEVTHTYSSIGEGLPSWSAGAIQLSNGTVLDAQTNINGYFKILDLPLGSNQWGDHYPAIACRNTMAFNQVYDSLYVIIETNDLNYQLYSLRGNIWVKRIDFEAANPGVYSPAPIKGVVGYKGKVVIAGNFISANGMTIHGLISFDPKTGHITNLPIPHSEVTSANCLGVYNIGDTTLYIPWYRGSYGTGLRSQTLYVLREQTTSPANIPPTANAGADQTITLPTNLVTFTGSGTDSDGTIAGYSWKKISGSGSITNPVAASTTVTNLTQGLSTFELTVTDNDGATGKDTVQVTVNAAPPAPNEPPVANAGTDQTITLPANSVTLSGSGTDSDGTIAKYTWTKVSGGSANIASPNATNTIVTGLVEGIYLFTFTVTDNDGAGATDTVRVTVTAVLPHTTDSITGHHMYPNPASSRITTTNTDAALVYDESGRVMPPVFTKSEGNLTLDVSRYAPGVYILKGKNNKELFTIKFVVAR